MADPPDSASSQWQLLWNERKLAFESALGPTTDRVFHALIPLHLGGSADVLEFPHHVPGSTYVTADLVGESGQPENTLGQYELMICTRSSEVWAPELISRLALYTLETIINPLDTMDIKPALPRHSTLAALLFTEPDVPNEFRVQGNRCGLLLCIGITEPELWACQRGRKPAVLSALKTRSIFPYTDLRRKSVV